MVPRTKSAARALSVLIVAGAVGPAISAEDVAFSVAGVLVHAEAFDRPHDVELQGDLAFVPGKGGSLAIVDVSNPNEPQLVWHEHDAKRLEEAETVLPAGGRLYLGTHEFVSIDVRNSRGPVFESWLSTEPPISNINGMAQRNDTVFAAGKNGVLAAFDVSAPAAPRVVGALDIREKYDIGWPHDVDVYGAYAIVPDPRQFGRVDEPGKLALIQVFDQDTGKLRSPEVWNLTGVTASEELVGANRVHVWGPYAYVGASTGGQGGRLVVVALHDPTKPRQVAWLPFAPTDGWGPNGLTVAGRVVFLAGGQSVEAIDVSRPEHPVKLASQRFPKVLANSHRQNAGKGDSAHDLVYRNGYLYVTGQNDNCLLILRVESDRIRTLSAHSTH